MSLRGYCRTLSERIDWRPAIRMRRLTTIARTGRLTNKSVNFMRVPHSALVTLLAFTPLLVELKVSLTVVLTLFGVRFRTIRRLHGVVNLNGCGVAEPEDSGADDFVARIHPGRDRDLIAAAALDLDDLLAHPAIGLTGLLILNVGHDVHGITVGRIVDG